MEAIIPWLKHNDQLMAQLQAENVELRKTCDTNGKLIAIENNLDEIYEGQILLLNKQIDCNVAVFESEMCLLEYKLDFEKNQLEEQLNEEKKKQERQLKKNEEFEQQVKQLKSALNSIKQQDKEKSGQLRRELVRERERSRDQTLTIASLRAETVNISQLEQQLQVCSKQLKRAQSDLTQTRDLKRQDQAKTNVLLKENGGYVRKIKQLQTEAIHFKEKSNRTIRELEFEQRANPSELHHLRKELSTMRESLAKIEKNLEKKHSDEQCKAKIKWAQVVRRSIVAIEEQVESSVVLGQLKPITIPELPVFPMNSATSSASSSLKETTADVFEGVKAVFPTISRDRVAAETVQIQSQEGEAAVTAERVVTSLVNKMNRESGEQSVSFVEDECPICHETMMDKKQEELTGCQKCKQHFHYDCAYEWLSKHKKECPMCRQLWLPECDFPKLQ